MTYKIAVTKIMFAILLWPLVVSVAYADETSEFSLSSNISIASDYVSRGLSLNWNQPSLQGSAEVAHRTGAYLGAYISQLTDHYYANGSVEVDLYAGLRQPLNDLFSYDIGLGAYFYPGANFRDAAPAGSYPDKRYDTVEAIFGISYRWLNLKYSRCLTDYYGYDDRTVPLSIWNSGVSGGVEPGQSTKGSDYYEANASFDLGSEVNIGLHAGRQNVTHSSRLSYSDYKISGTKALPQGWSATLSLSSTHGAEIYNNFLSVKGTEETMNIGGTHWLLLVNKAF